MLQANLLISWYINKLSKVLETGFVKRWSTDRKPTVMVSSQGQLVEINVNLKKFFTEPDFQLNDYTVAYQWDKLKKVFTKAKHDSKKLHLVPSSDTVKSVTEEVCLEYLNVQTWNSYNSFLLNASKTLNVIQFNEANWKLRKYSCYRWYKEYTCKHMLAFAERKGLFDYPIQAKNV